MSTRQQVTANLEKALAAYQAAQPLRLLDLYCGAGGATRGYQLAGFHVTGIDARPQPNYCGDEFILGDSLAADLSRFDFVHASPPCQKHTAMKTMHNAKAHVDLIPATRAKLQAWGGPWIIENVVGAPLICPIMLCGTMFGLGTGHAELQRHRLFELSAGWIMPPCCNHTRAAVIGVYGGHGRDRRRRKAGEHRGGQDFTVAERQEAMGIDWMNTRELSQAIPPAYTHFLATQWLKARR